MDVPTWLYVAAGAGVALAFIALLASAEDRRVPVARELGRFVRWASGQSGGPRVIGRACPRTACREVNPWKAQYCRRCGQSMDGASEVKAMRSRGEVT